MNPSTVYAVRTHQIRYDRELKIYHTFPPIGCALALKSNMLEPHGISYIGIAHSFPHILLEYTQIGSRNDQQERDRINIKIWNE